MPLLSWVQKLIWGNRANYVDNFSMGQAKNNEKNLSIKFS